jgi:hypothetical protein
MKNPVIEDVRDGAQNAWASTGAIASEAKASFMDRLEQVARVARVVRAFGVDDLLYRVGLQRRRNPYAVSGAFGAGVLVGAGVALTLNSAPGREALAAVGKAFRSFVGPAAAEGVESTAPDVAPRPHAHTATTGTGYAPEVKPTNRARGDA